MRIEQWRVRYSARGEHAKTFSTPAEAIEFVGDLERGDYLGLSHVVEKAMQVPGLPAADPATAETYRVRYMAMGVRTKTFDKASPAAEFYASLERGNALSLTHLVEDDVAPPKAVKIRPEKDVVIRPMFLSVPR